MKVLHAIPSLDPASGGPPLVAAGLAAAQAALGAEVHLVAYSFPNADQRVATALGSIPGIDRVHIDYLAPLSRAERFLARKARRDLRDKVHQFDIIHLHGVWDPLIRAVATVAQWSQKPFVLTPHGMLDPWSLRQKAVKKRAALLLGYRHMLNRAAFLHFLTDDERDGTAALNLQSPSRVIPNGLFFEEFQPLPPRGSFRSAHPAIADRPMVLFLSRLHYKKGLDILAPAFARVVREIPSTQLVVAGPDYGQKAAFEQQVQQLALGQSVHVVGPLYGAEKIAAYVDCDCFCLPSRQEGFSLAIIEALACQAPVVITPECHFPQAPKAGAGIVATLDTDAIAAALIKILADLPSARTMGQRGRDLVQQHFTWPRVARKMLDSYAEFIPATHP
jgi:glycosyltransferase involved in cell wall biosynthesis